MQTQPHTDTATATDTGSQPRSRSRCRSRRRSRRRNRRRSRRLSQSPVWLQDDLPQKSTTYRQKAPIAQYVRRIDAQIVVRFYAICSIHSSRRYFYSNYFNQRMRFLFAKLEGAAILPFCHEYIPTLHRSKIAKWRHTQAWRIKNASSD